MSLRLDALPCSTGWALSSWPHWPSDGEDADGVKHASARCSLKENRALARHSSSGALQHLSLVFCACPPPLTAWLVSGSFRVPACQFICLLSVFPASQDDDSWDRNEYSCSKWIYVYIFKWWWSYHYHSTLNTSSFSPPAACVCHRCLLVSCYPVALGCIARRKGAYWIPEILNQVLNLKFCSSVCRGDEARLARWGSS